MNALIIVCFFTTIIHLTETLAVSMRLAGVRTRQVATALSFLTTALLVSRLSNMLQAPFLGGLVDISILEDKVPALDGQFRLIILSAFIGTLLAAFLTPTFVRVFTRGIQIFDESGSVPRLIAASFKPHNLWGIIRCFQLPSFSTLKRMSLKGIPKTFLVLNLFIGSLYAIGVLASLYAGAQIPAYRTTASQLSGIVNGIATVLLALMVDPPGARITDQAVRGTRSEADVKSVVFYLVIGRVFGTLILSQLLFIPATEYIKDVTVLIKGVLLR